MQVFSHSYDKPEKSDVIKNLLNSIWFGVVHMFAIRGLGICSMDLRKLESEGSMIRLKDGQYA